MSNPNTLPPAFRAPPAPGMRNAYINPYPYTEWHYILRVDEDRWCLVDHSNTVATVGGPEQIAEALLHMPIAASLLDRTPRPHGKPRVPAEFEDLDLDAIMKDLAL